MRGGAIPETPRLLFRAHEKADEEAFVAMHTDPEVRRFAGNRAWGVDEARSRFRTRYLGKPEGLFGLWAAVLKSERTYVGMCGVHGTRDDAHLGYYIAPAYWRRGLASEAAHAFIQFGFRTLRAPQIYAESDAGNIASERILEMLGFSVVETETLPSGRLIRHYVVRLT